MLQGDYPRWTEYSHGNPDCWRRIYCGRLLHVIQFRDGNQIRHWRWHDASQEPFTIHSPFATKADAMAAAEQWAAASLEQEPARE